MVSIIIYGNVIGNFELNQGSACEFNILNIVDGLKMDALVFFFQDNYARTKKLSRFWKIMGIFLALYGAICWCHLLSVGQAVDFANTLVGGGVLLVSICAVFGLFISDKNRYFAIAVVLGFLLAIAFTLGKNIEASGVVDNIAALGNTGIADLKTYCVILGIAPVCAGCIVQLYSVLIKQEQLIAVKNSEKQRLDSSEKRFIAPKIDKSAKSLVFLSSKRIIAISGLVIFLCWIPILLVMFPGVNGYDSAYQIDQVITGNLDSKHPILHTLLLGACVRFGWLFSSNELGILTYSLIQMMFMAAVFGIVCRCVYVYSHSRWMFLCTLLWFALCPINSVFAISVTKDVIFAGLVTLSLCLYLVIVYERKNSFLFVFLLIICTTLMLLFRNNAIIAYGALLVLVGIWLLKHKKLNKKIAIVAIMPIVVVLALFNPLSSALGVTNTSNTQESLSVPLQQLARTATVSEDLSENDKEMINNLIPKWNMYQAGISDLVKSSFNTEYFNENKVEVLFRYISLGLRHSQVYTEAFLLNTYGYWYPDATALARGGFAYHPYFETPGNMEDLGERYFRVQHNCLIPVVGSCIENVLDNHIWEKIPGIATLMNSGAVIWFYLIALGDLLLKKARVALIVPFIFFVLYWLTCVLGPCLLLRYIYPLFTVLPFLLLIFSARIRADIHVET